MATTVLVRRKLLQALQNKLLPWAQADGASRVVLAQPPIVAPPGIAITQHRGKPLGETGQGRSHLYLHRWHAARVHATRFPYLGCVLEGEVDWRIGITQSTAQQLQGPEAHCRYQVLTMPQGTFFLMPPGVPYSDGAGVHWEASRAQPAHSRIFWLQILPSGAFCHICHSEGATHLSEPTLFLPDAQFTPTVAFLMEELRLRAPRYEIVAQTQLLALLLRAERALSHHSLAADAEVVNLSPQQSDIILLSNDLAVKRACSYIEANLNAPLNLREIAAHAYLSPSHLNRLFRAQLGATVMKYATQRRIEAAKSLLSTSDLPIHEIGQLVGYPQPSHFTQVFTQATMLSPLEYRRRNPA